MTDNERACNEAALITQFGPTLTRFEAELLDDCPYEAPLFISEPKARRTAKRLEKIGLLEHDPSSVRRFRVTMVGRALVDQWKRAGWLK